MTRRILGFFLAALLVMAAMPALAQTRVMVATDLHYLDSSYVEDPDRLLRSARGGDGKAPQHSKAWLRALVSSVLDEKPDVLVLTGDQTYNGEVMSHKAVSMALAEIEELGIDVLAIAGNHDINNDRAYAFRTDGMEAVHSLPLFRYGKYYDAFGHDLAFSRDTVSMSYAVKLTDTLWLLMLDAGIYEPFAEPFGLIEVSTQDWMRNVLTQAREACAQVITTSHQSMLPHSSMISAGYMIINWEEVSALLAEFGVRLNLSGHIHMQHIAQQDGLYDISLAALSSQPNQYAMLTVEDDGSLLYETRRLSAAHLPEGVTEDSAQFFMNASRNNITDALASFDLTQADREAMTELAVQVNRHYFAGTLSTVWDTLAGDPALAQWEETGDGVRWYTYLSSMLEDVTTDMNRLELPAFE